jgi:phytol kinase
MFHLFLLGLLSLGFGFALVFLLDSVSGRGELLKGLSRKLFHAAVFTGAVPAHLSLGFWGVVVYGVVMVVFVLLSLREGEGSSLYDALARANDGDATGRSILLPLVATALGGLVNVLLVGDFAVVGYLVCGWGDAVGEPAGARWGRHRYISPFSTGPGQARSLEGSAAVLLAGAAGGWVALGLLGVPQPQALGMGLVCGTAGAVAEGLSSRGTDNFWAQLVPALVAAWVVG